MYSKGTRRSNKSRKSCWLFTFGMQTDVPSCGVRIGSELEEGGGGRDGTTMKLKVAITGRLLSERLG
jgi:hypothetical protein